MKLGIVISSNDPETVWNALRLGNFALKEGDEVKTFLMAKGVEIESLDNSTFQINEQLNAFIGNNGKIFACGTCLKLRQKEGSEVCPLSTMKDLYEIIKECDKVISF
jgi:uncharacterized protein involved in oxidation of intracellular sulfur